MIDKDSLLEGDGVTPERISKLWTLPFLTFVVLNLFLFMGFDILLPILSLYLENNGSSEAEIGRIFSCFTVSAIMMRMLSVSLAARFGVLGLIRLGLLVCGGAVIAYWWVDTTPSAMIIRFLHGLGFGLASTLVTALASQIIPPARLGEGMNYLGLGTTVTLAAGPFFGLWLKDNFGYLVMFLVVAGVYLLGIVWSFNLPTMKLSRITGLRPRPVFLSRLVLVPSLLMFLTGIAVSSTVIYMALYCQEKGLPYAAHFFVLSTGGIFISRLFSGRLYDRLGHRFVIAPAVTLMFLATLILALGLGRNALFITSILWGFGIGALFPSIQALAFAITPLNQRTEVTASIFNSLDLGFGSGSFVLGLLAERAGTYQIVYWAAAGDTLVFLTFYLVYYLRLHPSVQKGKLVQEY